MKKIRIRWKQTIIFQYISFQMYKHTRRLEDRRNRRCAIQYGSGKSWVHLSVHCSSISVRMKLRMKSSCPPPPPTIRRTTSSSPGVAALTSGDDEAVNEASRDSQLCAASLGWMHSWKRSAPSRINARNNRPFRFPQPWSFISQVIFTSEKCLSRVPRENHGRTSSLYSPRQWTSSSLTQIILPSSSVYRKEII